MKNKTLVLIIAVMSVAITSASFIFLTAIDSTVLNFAERVLFVSFSMIVVAITASCYLRLLEQDARRD